MKKYPFALPIIGLLLTLTLIGKSIYSHNWNAMFAWFVVLIYDFKWLIEKVVDFFVDEEPKDNSWQ